MKDLYETTGENEKNIGQRKTATELDNHSDMTYV